MRLVLLFIFLFTRLISQAQMRFTESYVRKVTFDDTVKVQSCKGFYLIEAQPPGTRRVCRFVLSTAFPVCVTKQLAKEIRYKPTGFVKASFAGQPDESYASGLLETFTLNRTEFEFVNAVIASDTIETFLQALHADGIIGSNLFNAACWQLNIREGYLRFSGKTGHFEHLKKTLKVNMPKTKGIFQAVFHTEINGQKVKLIPDMLYPGWIRTGKDFSAQYLTSPGKAKIPSVTALFAGNDTLNVQIGNVRIKDWPSIDFVALADSTSEHSLIGRWLFEQCIITLDCINYQAHITFPESLKQPLWMGGYHGKEIMVSTGAPGSGSLSSGDILINPADSMEGALFYRLPEMVQRNGKQIRP